ncbi:hypothetical protein SK128_014212 [Halocaridina rubra]|uniref:Uncharacterized protein n=1 Tax=Halocaridina rubra TaxID=373956 RepID=A0AAN8WUM6_HALRR
MDLQGKQTSYQEEFASKLQSLKERGRRAREVNAQNFEWIEHTDDIGFWEFINECPGKLYLFQIRLDISGWEKLAERLGLKAEDIIWCSKFHKDGPTFEMFHLLAKKGELKSLTLKKVLMELRSLERLDILIGCGFEENIENFRTLQRKNGVSSKVNPWVNECNYGVLSPSMKAATFAVNIHQAPEILVNSAYVGEVKKPTSETGKSSFAVRILMIFALDAKEEALRTAEQFRKAVNERKAIGVMTLFPPNTPAIANALLVNPANSIHKWFKQVHFVVPVLSPKFLLQIQARDNDPETLYECQYNRYVYRLLQDNYVSNGSRNYKCRPVYPQKYCREVRNSELVKDNGLLQINWNCSSEEQVEELGTILIDCVKEKRRKGKT